MLAVGQFYYGGVDIDFFSIDGTYLNGNDLD